MKNKLMSLIVVIGIMILISTLINGCGSTSTNYFYYYPDWTPDGKIICSKNTQTVSQGSGTIGGSGGYVTNYYTFTIMDSNGSNESDIRSIGNAAKVSSSPLNNYYAYNEINSNIIHIITTSGSFVSDINAGAIVYSFDWSPDESKIVYGTLSGESFVISKDGTGKTQISNGGSEIAWRWGDRIIYKGTIGSDWGGIILNGFNLSVLFTNTKSKGGEFNISKTNTNEAYYRGDKIYKVLINTSEAIPILVINSDSLWNIRLSPDGQTIIATGSNAGGEGIWLINIDGSGLRQLR